jgi:hypothetical protein
MVRNSTRLLIAISFYIAFFRLSSRKGDRRALLALQEGQENLRPELGEEVVRLGAASIVAHAGC